jgi:hypothetical protein
MDPLSRHVRYDVDALSGAMDLTSKTPDAIPLIRDHRLLSGIVPSHHIHKTSFDAGPAAGTFFRIDFNVCTHAASKPGCRGNTPKQSFSLRILYRFPEGGLRGC